MPPHERVIDLDVDDRTDQVTTAVQTYTVSVACQNCDYEGEAELPKGMKVDKAPCPQCACIELVRVKQPGKGEDIRKEVVAQLPSWTEEEREPEMAPSSREQLDRISRDGCHSPSPPIAPPAQGRWVPMTPAPSRPAPPPIPVGPPSRVYTPADSNQYAAWVHNNCQEEQKTIAWKYLQQLRRSPAA